MAYRTLERDANDSKLVQSYDRWFNQIIDSETFRGAPVMRGLLVYLWRSQGGVISEYAIAVDPLGRPPDFDPKGDATVRVSIARLRTKLKEDCQRETEAMPFQLTIPLGSHELQWIQNSQAPSRWSVLRSLPLFYRNILLGSLAAGTIFAVLCIVMV